MLSLTSRVHSAQLRKNIEAIEKFKLKYEDVEFVQEYGCVYDVVSEQLLLSLLHPSRRRYSSSLMQACARLEETSSAAYLIARGTFGLILPHPQYESIVWRVLSNGCTCKLSTWA